MITSINSLSMHLRFVVEHMFVGSKVFVTNKALDF